MQGRRAAELVVRTGPSEVPGIWKDLQLWLTMPASADLLAPASSAPFAFSVASFSQGRSNPAPFALLAVPEPLPWAALHDDAAPLPRHRTSNHLKLPLCHQQTDIDDLATPNPKLLVLSPHSSPFAMLVNPISTYSPQPEAQSAIRFPLHRF